MYLRWNNYKTEIDRNVTRPGTKSLSILPSSSFLASHRWHGKMKCSVWAGTSTATSSRNQPGAVPLLSCPIRSFWTCYKHKQHKIHQYWTRYFLSAPHKIRGLYLLMSSVTFMSWFLLVLKIFFNWPSRGSNYYPLFQIKMALTARKINNVGEN